MLHNNVFYEIFIAMKADWRVQFIIDQVNSAGKEIDPEAKPMGIEDTDKKTIALLLNVFDRLLPTVVNLIAAKIDYQKKAKN